MADSERIAELERDLAESLERQSAADRVLEVLGRSTFELEPVFETVLQQAVRLCRADAGLIYVLDGDVYRCAVTLGASQAYRDYIMGVPLQAGSGTVVGRVGVRAADGPDPRRPQRPGVHDGARARARRLPHDARRADAAPRTACSA